jgi:hypothetical protein
VTLLQAIKYFLIAIEAIKNFIISYKKQEIIKIKDEALENGDQRTLESNLSKEVGHPDATLLDNYDKLYERPVKKKP